MNVFSRKLKDMTGDSIAEVLVASLIIALALIALVSMLMVSRRLITASDRNFSENTELRSDIELQHGAEQPATVIVTGNGTGASTKGTESTDAAREILSLDKNIEIPVNALSFSQNGKEDNNRIFMYRKTDSGNTKPTTSDSGRDSVTGTEPAGSNGTEG